MMRSLFSGVAGIKVHQTRMDVIGNNIANINTIGFKGSRTTFSDMLSQLQSAASAPTESRGGVNPRQVGLGVNVESIDLIFSDSSPQSTGKNTDLALAGNGLFYLREGNQEYYTRNGSFLFDEQGFYVMSGSGLRVQGWNAVNGVLNTNGASTDIKVPVGRTMDATETTEIEYTGNLDKESKLIKSITYTASTSEDADEMKVVTGRTKNGENITGTTTSVNVDGKNVVAATITLRDDTTLTVTSGYYEVGKSVPITTIATIYDSLGGKHEVTLLLDKDPSSTGGDATPTDADALATGRTTYTDANNNTHTVTPTTGATYTDADGNKYILTPTTYTYTDAQGNTYTLTHNTDDDTYTYTDANGEQRRVNINNSNVTQNYTYTDANNNQHNLTRNTDNDTYTDTDAQGNEQTVDASAVNTKDTVSYTYTDAEGNEQTVAVSAVNTVYDNRWRVYINPGVGEKGPAFENFKNSYTRSEVTENAESDGSTTVGTMNMLSYLYFNDKGAFVNNGTDRDASVTFEYSDGNGAASNQAVLNFDGLTQYANSTTSFPTTNGNAAGTLQSITVDSSGIITGAYSNGLLRSEAQVAVAQFINPAGLMKVGTTIYQESNNSGAANVRTVADFGLDIVSSALEMSNVDLATEFSEMIVTQRGFQANSKMTTVSDEMLETLINMKR